MTDFNKLEEEQCRLSKKAVIKDRFEKLDMVGGVDCAYSKNNVIAAIVICEYPSMNVIEKSHSFAETRISYLPGFLSYREGSSISDAYSKLQNKPDVLIFDGNGILHPRRCGIATHMGILLEQATIGVAKNLMIGETVGEIIKVNDESRGQAVFTKKHAKPVYVSPGHMISLKTSVKVVKKCVRDPHKLPEPLHLAHKLAREIAEKI